MNILGTIAEFKSVKELLNEKMTNCFLLNRFQSLAGRSRDGGDRGNFSFRFASVRSDLRNDIERNRFEWNEERWECEKFEFLIFFKGFNF